MDKRRNWRKKNLAFNSSYKPQIKPFSRHFRENYSPAQKTCFLVSSCEQSGHWIVWLLSEGFTRQSVREAVLIISWCYIRPLTREMIKNQILTEFCLRCSSSELIYSHHLWTSDIMNNSKGINAYTLPVDCGLINTPVGNEARWNEVRQSWSIRSLM